jgi:hypothetical protein
MNNRGEIGFKTLVYLVILGYATFAGYRLVMTHFTKSSIEEEAMNIINKVKKPNFNEFSEDSEHAEKLLLDILKREGVYVNDKQVFVTPTEDGKSIHYEISYKIRTDLLLFQTNWEEVKISKDSLIANRL